ncbi:uncharacterized protein KY384_001458 [Bacidia gigantensis]|uniref:uncharacterized protein n=1 Tax=Bacidia gigantensis TaxID=2732470 RepID=UPI001D044C26|nr:uncharacterized protein KY384_001458 [Bacidia gigantensis]KAG8533717.1 hypothetical protein KY384_001458 [Bacidia gigantensis]
MQLSSQEQINYCILRDSIADPVIARSIGLENKSRKKGSKKKHSPALDSPTESNDDAADLADFIDYLATEVFAALPLELRDISYATINNDSILASQYDVPLLPETFAYLITVIPSSVVDSLVAYSFLPSSDDIPNFLLPLLEEYISGAVKAPHPNDPAKRATACEICERDWIPLTYHHLIPRQVQAKAIKRGWHEEWRLESVAWLCRACHSFVHRLATNEELAKQWWSIEKLMDREDIQTWAKWVGRVRWKSK